MNRDVTNQEITSERVQKGVMENGDWIEATESEVLAGAENGKLYWCEMHDCYHIYTDVEFKGIREGLLSD